MIYTEVFDIAIKAIEKQFSYQKDQVYSEVLELFKSIIHKDVLKLEAFYNFYDKDLNKFNLSTQLRTFSVITKNIIAELDLNLGEAIQKLGYQKR